MMICWMFWDFSLDFLDSDDLGEGGVLDLMLVMVLVFGY